MRTSLVIVCIVAAFASVSAAPAESSNPTPTPPAPTCSKGGQTYKAGDTFEDGKFWFNCTRSGKPRAIGCVHEGHRLNDGDTFTVNGAVHECTIDVATQGTRVIGCVQVTGGTTITRNLNCHWVEGDAPQQYDVMCKYDEAAQTATKVVLKCNYNVNNAVYVIEPGCHRSINNATVGCAKDGDNVKYVTSTDGLQAC